MFSVLKKAAVRMIAAATAFFKKAAVLVKICCSVVKNSISKIFRKESVIFLVGTPEYGNMGDQLIAAGEVEWLRAFSSRKIIEFTQERLLRDRKCRELLSQVKKDDIIFLQGGGNLNNKYMKCEGIRRTVISKLQNNRIILFQQSIHFDDDYEAQQIKKKTCEIYNSHKHLEIFTREDTSFAAAKEMFPDLQVYKLPDMAVFLFNRVAPSQDFERDGVLFCIRNDAEKYYSSEKMGAVMSKLSEKYSISTGDTHIGRTVNPENRMQDIQSLIDEMAHYRLIVTDRFHGVIFSILSQTPCIALKSTDHKISDGVKWFEDYNGLKFAESADEIPQMTDELYFVGELSHPDNLKAYFEQMKNIVFSEDE